jgi:hypothetical protein
MGGTVRACVSFYLPSEIQNSALYSARLQKAKTLEQGSNATVVAGSISAKYYVTYFFLTLTRQNIISIPVWDVLRQADELSFLNG